MRANSENYPELLIETESNRFWSKVDKNGMWSLIKNVKGQCWIWTAGKNHNGYGVFSLRGKQSRAYRLSYVISKGQISENLEVDHLCRNRACVNPNHLEAVTNKENTLRGNSPAAIHSRKTHCPKGHLYSDKNTRVTPTGGRICRSCDRLRKSSARAT